MTLLPKNQKLINKNTKATNPGRESKGGSKETMLWIRWRLIGARPTDAEIYDLTGIQADDPNLEAYLQIHDQLSFSAGRDSLQKIRERLLGVDP